MKAECVIITGSSGLIGSAFIDRIGERFQEFGFAREGPPHPPPATDHVIDCDLGSEVSGQRLASVIHLAAYYNFSGQPSPLYIFYRALSGGLSIGPHPDGVGAVLQ